MAHHAPAEIASTIQAASINFSPDPRYDANPSTSASRKTPVHLSSFPRAGTDPEGDAAPDEIPLSALEPPPRKQNLPPLPDLRFEQSYLARIKPALDQKRYWRVTWLTVVDHVLMPLAQGVAWNLSVWGWRAWNTAVKFQGEGVGARVRRWWWTTNNWSLPAGNAGVGSQNSRTAPGR